MPRKPTVCTKVTDNGLAWIEKMQAQTGATRSAVLKAALRYAAQHEGDVAAIIRKKEQP